LKSEIGVSGIIKGMITLNKENFKKTLAESEKLMVVKFFRKSCGNCEKMAPLLLELEQDKTISVAEIDADTIKDIVQAEYAPKGKMWQFPLVGYFIKGEMIGATTGIVSLEELQIPLRGITEIESMAYRAEKSLRFINEEAKSISRTLDILESCIQLRAVAELKANQQPAQKPKAKKKAVDLSGFPEEQEAPCDGCQ
jgi:thiol-disulfide isomerase/thioredoxin